MAESVRFLEFQMFIPLLFCLVILGKLPLLSLRLLICNKGYIRQLLLKNKLPENRVAYVKKHLVISRVL